MSELTPLREAVETLASRSPAPDFDDLKRRAARRGRRRTASIAAAAACFIVGTSLVAGTLGDSDQSPPIGEPSTPSSESSPAPEESSVGERYRILRETLTSVSGWTVSGPATGKPTALARCEGNWMAGPGGRGAGHNLGLSVSPEEPPIAWAQEVEGFTSPARASDALDRLISNLTSCTAESWRSRPIAETGAVIAFTDAGVLWVHQRGDSVAELYVPTTDGPPPTSVLVEVADLVYSWFG